MSHAAPGTFAIGGDLTVDRIGFGAMRLARNGMGDTVTRDPETARAVLRRAADGRAPMIARVPGRAARTARACAPIPEVAPVITSVRVGSGMIAVSLS